MYVVDDGAPRTADPLIKHAVARGSPRSFLSPRLLPDPMKPFETDTLATERRRHDAPYHEFLRVASMSCGIYFLAAGAEDRQSPHSEDEVYYVVSGEAKIRIGTEDHPVRPGSVVYVQANAPHRFHSIARDLTVLVVFAPPEESRDQ